MALRGHETLVERTVKKPVLLARIRIRAAQLKNNEMWHSISYSPKRVVRCSCGGGVEDIPQTGEYDGGGCSHIVAFYAGDVTEDRRVAADTPASGAKARMFPLGERPAQPWLVQLTAVGRDLFEWRWAAKKLASS